MRSRIRFVVALGVLALASAAAVRADVVVGPGGGTPGTSSSFELVGHEPLFDRGMNAALAIFDNYVYIGNRTDGSSRCGAGDPRGARNPDSCPHPHPGILIVDASHPSSPTVVGEIGPPNAGLVGITTRELRVWPEQKLLIVMTFRCSSVIHACPPGNDTTFPFDLKFFDLSDPLNPQLISTYVPTSKAGVEVKPHEMYLWVDPTSSHRALLWISTPTTSVDPALPNLLIVDISDVPSGGAVTQVAEGNWNQLFPGAANPANYDNDLALHSMAPSVDGTRTYLAYLRGGFGVLDTTKVAKGQVPGGTVESLNDDLLTTVPFPAWGTGPMCPGHTAAGCTESHSALPFFGRPFALTIDEVYGTFTAPSFGWPWGWARTWDVSHPERPRLLGEYKLFQNTEGFRPQVDPATEQFTSYSSHNPTLTRNLVFDAWHSGGLQAIDVSDPVRPAQVGWFSPEPLHSVANEDPALSRGPNKVVMWSYPIVKDGLIYVVDVRNGLYVLRYTGHRSAEVDRVAFLEGNSNLGDALRLGRTRH